MLATVVAAVYAFTGYALRRIYCEAKMKLNDLSKPKMPQVKVNKKLNKLAGQILFPEKLAKANKILAATQKPDFSKIRPAKTSLPVKVSVVVKAR